MLHKKATEQRSRAESRYYATYMEMAPQPKSRGQVTQLLGIEDQQLRSLAQLWVPGEFQPWLLLPGLWHQLGLLTVVTTSNAYERKLFPCCP